MVFNTIKGYLYGFIALVLIAVFASFMVSNAALRSKLASSIEDVETLTTEKAVLQSDLDAATREVKRNEKEKDRLLDEINYLSKIYADSIAAQKANTARLQDQLTAAHDYIRDSKDETVIYWANEYVPAELNSMLSKAANCSNSDSKQTGLCASADRVNWEVRGSSVQGSSK